LKRCSNIECCKQCRYVMFKGTMTKWPVQKLAQGTTQKVLQHHDATDIWKTYIFVFFGFFCFCFLFIDTFLKEFSKKCWVTALVRSMTFIGGLNHNLHLFSKCMFKSIIFMQMWTQMWIRKFSEIHYIVHMC